MSPTKVVSQSEYLRARLDLLSKEKEVTRATDDVALKRRNLPVVEITKSYEFTGINPKTGEETTMSLAHLFSHHRQLIIYHFMFDPSWDAGCESCSLIGDHMPPLEHLQYRDTAMVCVSRAPVAKIDAYKKRMGWTFPWVSSYGSDFNYDFHVTQDSGVVPINYNFKDEDEIKKRGLTWTSHGEQPGISCFVLGGGDLGIGEEGKVYHTYSTYARGVEKQVSTFGWLDMTLLGRQDEDKGGPGFLRRDEYTPEDLKGTA